MRKSLLTLLTIRRKAVHNQDTLVQRPYLPPEILRIIWGYCIPPPRYVWISWDKHTPAPVIFHVCKTSRAMAQEYSYELAFAPAGFIYTSEGISVPLNEILTAETTPRAQRLVWFNFSKDVLCTSQLVLNPRCSYCPDSLQRVRSLGLKYPTWAMGSALDYHEIVRYIPRYTDLEGYSKVEEVVLAWPPLKYIPKEGFIVATDPVQGSDAELCACRQLQDILKRRDERPPSTRVCLSYSGYDPFHDPANIPEPDKTYFYVLPSLSVLRLSRDQVSYYSQPEARTSWIEDWLRDVTYEEYILI